MPLIRWLDRHFEEAICCFCLSLVSICVFLQVIMRYVFNTALQWSEEVAAMGMVWAVYMGASLCVRERFHIRIMAGVLLFPTKIARSVIIFADLLWAMFCIFMLVISYEYLSVLAQYTSRTPRLGIDEFYPQSILVIGYGLMLLRLLQIYLEWARSGYRGLPGMRPEHQIDLETGLEK